MTDTDRIHRALEILDKPYSWIFVPEDDGWYSCGIGEFPGCYSQGRSLAEAADNLRHAAVGWLVVSMEHGHDTPEPMSILTFEHYGKQVKRNAR